jgi:hypothetical protein
MNKNEIQEVMKIIRPAIIAIYGRQPLQMIRYNLNDDYGWFYIQGRKDIYTVKVIEWYKVVYLGIE